MMLELQNNILILLLLLSFVVQAQISGYVYDSVTKEPLESVNIFDILNKTGTSTDQNGRFILKSIKGSTISISSIGYKTKKYIINKNIIGTIYLHPLSKMIPEVRISKHEDPAITIMKRVIKNNNHINKEDLLPNREELLKIYLNNKENSIHPLNHSVRFQEYSKSLKNRVPFYISTHRYKDYLLVAESSYGVSIKKQYFKDYINSIDIDFDIQSDRINILGRNIVSPISKDALSYYNYYLYDSSFVNHQYCYKIKIVPNDETNVAFNGIIWINTSSFQVQKTEIFLNNKFINFIQNLALHQEFNSNGSERHQIKKHIQLSLSLSDLYLPDSLSILIDKDISWFKDEKTSVNTSKKSSLLKKEIAIIQSLNDDPHVKRITQLSELFISSYLTINIIDIGPIYEALSNNTVEGQRISLLARTNRKFLRNTLISGYIGKGLRDNRNKYSLGMKIRNKEKNSFQLGFRIKSDIEYVGSSFIRNSLDPNRLNYSSESLLYSLFRRSNNDEMTYFKKKEISLTKELNKLSISLFYNQKSVEKNEDLLITDNLSQSNRGIKMRYSVEKKVRNHFDIINIKSQAPVFFGEINFIKNKSSKENSFKAQFATLHTINTSILGKIKYLLDIGIIMSHDYSSLYNLEIHRGNESYIYDFNKSSLMNKYEFISDRYSALYIEQHLNGRILNKVPILKAMRLREVFISNILLGNVHNKSNLDRIPDFTTPLSYNNPYIEVGIGLENILRMIRVHAIWRLTHIENNNITRFGIFGSFYIAL